MVVGIEIDEITNCLIDASTGEECETEYHLIDKPISKKVVNKLKCEGWLFDWSVPQNNGSNVYKLTLKGDELIQGLIAIQPHEDACAMYVEIVESAPHNIGKHKTFKGVGPHLFAIACKLSFEVGYDGAVYFISKTKLVEHYMKSLNAKIIGDRKLLIDTSEAKVLVEKYFKETY